MLVSLCLTEVKSNAYLTGLNVRVEGNNGYRFDLQTVNFHVCGI